MNICKNCKYCSYESSTYICKHDTSVQIEERTNTITGKKTKTIYKGCSTMRFYSNCGEQGILFEEREDLVYKVMKFFKKVIA